MIESKRWLLPDGVDELLPAQAKRLEAARRAVLDLFALSGFSQIQPPLVEFEDSLLIGLGGDVAAQSMRLTDQVSGRPMALRADVSSQAARIDAHSMHAEGVNRLSYVEPVVHAKPRSQWASRSPLMAGAELFGVEGIDADIEIILLMISALRTAESSLASEGVEPLQLTLDLGHVAIGRAVVEALRNDGCSDGSVELIRDALQRKSRPDLKQLVKEYVQSEELGAFLLELPMVCGDQSILKNIRQRLPVISDAVESALDQLESVIAVVGECFPQLDLYCDLAETRGYDYHTGLVFAVYCPGYGSALANGGRYDGVGEVFGRRRSATGFNADLKALRRLFDSKFFQGEQKQQPDASLSQKIIAAPAPGIVSIDQLSSLWRLVEDLRKSGETVVFVSDNEKHQYSHQLKFQGDAWCVEVIEGDE